MGVPVCCVFTPTPALPLRGRGFCPAVVGDSGASVCWPFTATPSPWGRTGLAEERLSSPLVVRDSWFVVRQAHHERIEIDSAIVLLLRERGLLARGNEQARFTAQVAGGRPHPNPLPEGEGIFERWSAFSAGAFCYLFTPTLALPLPLRGRGFLSGGRCFRRVLFCCVFTPTLALPLRGREFLSGGWCPGGSFLLRFRPHPGPPPGFGK